MHIARQQQRHSVKSAQQQHQDGAERSLVGGCLFVSSNPHFIGPLSGCMDFELFEEHRLSAAF